jgi:hypothetical protein
MRPKEYVLRLGGGLACIIGIVVVIRGGVMKRGDELSTKSVPQLVKLYNSAPGADDAVGPEFKRRGDPARDELIRMLDAIPQDQLRKNVETIDTIATVLEYAFPSQASSDALDRFRSRVTDPVMQDELRDSSAKLRAEMRGAWSEAWWQANRAMSPREQNLHYEELLMANAAPGDRVFFLVWTAQTALEVGQYAKAEAYAREILATPGLAAKTGDGVYYGNHVLGMVALHQGDIAAAKHYLIESAKTPGSYVLNGIRPPDTSLAIALLERGEREAVFEYLDLCKVFSKKDALIEGWKKTILAGGVPRFWPDWLEANLGRKIEKPW